MMERNASTDATSGDDAFGKNTAVLFAALAAYLVVAGNAWVGYLLMFAAALMWVGESHQPKETRPQEFAARFGAY